MTQSNSSFELSSGQTVVRIPNLYLVTVQSATPIKVGEGTGTAELSSQRPEATPQVGTVTHSPAPQFSDAIKSAESKWRKYTESNKDRKLIPYQTLMNTIDFLEYLAVHSSLVPEVSAFPNGEIGLEWHTELGELTVLVDEANTYFFYEGRSGRRRKGSEPWTKTIPQDVLELLGKLAA